MYERLSCLLAALCLLPVHSSRAQSRPADLRPFRVILTLGLKDREETDWSAEVTVSRGRIASIQEWHGGSEARFEVGKPFTVRTRRDIRRKRKPPLPAKVVLTGTVGSEAVLTIKTARGTIVQNPAAMVPGRMMMALGGEAGLETAAKARALSGSAEEPVEHDYPAACVGPDGTAWAVWQAYRGNQSDVLMLAARAAGKDWQEPARVPDVEGDLAQVACAVVNEGLLLVWSRRFPEGWDLEWKLRKNDGGWQPAKRLTRTPGTDLEAELAALPDGSAVVVWQGFAKGNFDIFLARFGGGKWGEARNVSDHPANDWRPVVAISGEGAVAVVWDSYRYGSYDVLLRTGDSDALGSTRAVAASPLFEANAAAAWNPDGSLWIGWEEGTRGWGKDQGAVVPKPKPGSGLYGARGLRLAVVRGDRLFRPVADVARMPGISLRHMTEKLRLCSGPKGTMYVVFRTVHQQVKAHPWGHGRFRSNRAWETYVTAVDGEGWIRPVPLPHHYGRIDSFPCAVPGPGGGLTVVLHSDERTYKDLRKMTRNRILAFDLPLPPLRARPVLQAIPWAEPEVLGEKERVDTDRIRAYRTEVKGASLRIARGDTHRHTEISWDGNGDGSVIDLFRYAIDAGALDFIMVSDHNQRTGPDIEYVWWRSQKLSDLYHNPPTFVTLLGYERSLGFPNGHRNVINAKRGYRVFSMTRRTDGKGGVADDDTKQLYAYARKTGSIVISHTSGTKMGTDWRDNDPEIEPVVEIYQGARTSYEYEGAPKSAGPGDRHAKGSGYQPEGFVWRAWRKGLKLGVVASSDHGSTHISYASVYTPEMSRQAIVESIRKRQTYGATDNIILDFRTGEEFMGREMGSRAAPAFRIRVMGTGELSAVEIIKNFQFVYVTDPEGTSVDLTWRDGAFEADENLYYVRVRQDDGQIAWSSPIWIRRQ